VWISGGTVTATEDEHMRTMANDGELEMMENSATADIRGHAELHHRLTLNQPACSSSDKSEIIICAKARARQLRRWYEGSEEA
jgi:hypothetical protein